jgi:hypothetical protein
MPHLDFIASMTKWLIMPFGFKALLQFHEMNVIVWLGRKNKFASTQISIMPFGFKALLQFHEMNVIVWLGRKNKFASTQISI